MEIPATVKMVVVTKKLIGHVDPIHRAAGTYEDLGDRSPSIFGIIVFPISDRVGGGANFSYQTQVWRQA